LTLVNGTVLELAFELEAQDVIVRDGRRVFVPAGERDSSPSRRALPLRSTSPSPCPPTPSTGR
jgi:hypothetical protein